MFQRRTPWAATSGGGVYMIDEQGNPWTPHTTNPVPLILIEGEKAKIPGHGSLVIGDFSMSKTQRRVAEQDRINIDANNIDQVLVLRTA